MENVENNLQKRFPNCGIIFLQPYVNQLFEEQELLLNNKFENRAAKIKAIQLLYYLATSKVGFAEAEDLSIFKILVEIPAEELIVFPKPLTKKEKDVCEIVLQSLIKHWSALKNISIEGLQTQFIQREGLMNITENSIEINLEASAVDILLDQIPFNYSLIKLPWLEKLFVTKI